MFLYLPMTVAVLVCSTSRAALSQSGSAQVDFTETDNTDGPILEITVLEDWPQDLQMLPPIVMGDLDSDLIVLQTVPYVQSNEFATRSKRLTVRPKQTCMGQVKQGLATWYGPGFQGRPTANPGERFNTYANTAASLTYPLNCHVKVTNTLTGVSIVVRINDRGPYVNGRVIDLSYVAASYIGIVRAGKAPVRIQCVSET